MRLRAEAIYVRKAESRNIPFTLNYQKGVMLYIKREVFPNNIT